MLDNNLRFSWLLTRGHTLTRVIDGWRDGRYVSLTSQPIFAELRRLIDKLPERQRMTGEWIKHLDAMVLDSVWTAGEPVAAGACRDPKDDMFLSCAVEGEADFIVTGDKDLLDMGSFRGVRIVTPVEFLIRLDVA